MNTQSDTNVRTLSNNNSDTATSDHLLDYVVGSTPKSNSIHEYILKTGQEPKFDGPVFSGPHIDKYAKRRQEELEESAEEVFTKQHASEKEAREAEKEGLKAGLKALGKKVAKAAANEFIEELPGPPGRIARMIKSEVKKADKKRKEEELAKQILNTVKGKGDYKIGATRTRRPKNGRLGATIRGHGDYTVHSNSIAMSSFVSADTDIVPSFKGKTRETRVMHREYLGDVISSSTSGAFSNTTYKINPGVVTSFPWLSVIAQNFDQWRPNGIVVCFKSTSSVYNGSSQALGTVIIASDYDLTDASYSSKIEMENSEFAVSAKCSDNILHPIECAIGERQVKLLKCRGVTTPTDNLQWYDLCNLQVATQGITGTSVNLGELWITYDISFFKEQLYGNLFGNSILAHKMYATAGVSTSAYFGTSQNEDSSNTLDLTYGTSTITFPSNLSAGSYIFHITWFGTSTACTTPTLAYTSNCSAGPGIFGSSDTSNISPVSTTVGFQKCFTVTLTGPSAVLTFSSGTLPASITEVDLYCSQINSSVA